ncbi:MAG: hypothetical protein WBV94_06150 [Blastocatellia bacterium]
MRLFVEIQKGEGGYTGSVHQGNPGAAEKLANLLLKPDDAVIINRQSYGLGVLVDKLIAFRPDEMDNLFNERGQLEIGQHLHAQTIGKLAPDKFRDSRNDRSATDKGIEIRIVTDDEHVARLPWSLLADRGVFLSTAGWSVALSRQSESRACELPPSPKILAIMPEPVSIGSDIPPTNAKQHLDKLEEMLSAANSLHRVGDKLQVAQTWSEFEQKVDAFQPDIIYYYGHGVGDITRTHLVFADSSKRREDRPMVDFATRLRNLGRNAPRLAYINCCMGEAGGFLGAGWQLGDFIPAVITNFSRANPDAAQAQGLALWRSILLEGNAPHIAIAEMRRESVRLNLSLRDVRWMTPVLHCNYDSWRFTPPPPLTDLERDLNRWLKLDRSSQISDVMYRASETLKNGSPKSLAYVWYGEQGQGVQMFHQRLKVEMQSNSEIFVMEISPQWPQEFHDFHRSVTDMLTEAFSVKRLEEIADDIRARLQDAPGRHTLVYVCHEPIVAGMNVKLSTLKKYLEWWDSNFAPLLEENIYGLVAVSYIVGSPADFRTRVTEVGLEDMDLACTEFHVLNEMGTILAKDLKDFLRRHKPNVPKPRRDRIVEKLIAETKGQYEKVLERLREIDRLIWEDETVEEQKVEGSKGEDEDYY